MSSPHLLQNIYTCVRYLYSSTATMTAFSSQTRNATGSDSATVAAPQPKRGGAILSTSPSHGLRRMERNLGLERPVASMTGNEKTR
ncbi:hypothetical protein MKX08_001972 [Trichoderma sp. CBMAI-0020]|nr:hypothetical protein MKX08_001972 [Trichoderma sp. CBMAI-0020]